MKIIPVRHRRARERALQRLDRVLHWAWGMRIGLLLAAGIVAELGLLVTIVSDTVSMARVALAVALATQAAANATHVVQRGMRSLQH